MKFPLQGMSNPELLDHVEAMILILDFQGKIQWLNQCMAGFLTVDRSEVTGKNWFDNYVQLSGRSSSATEFMDWMTAGVEDTLIQEYTVINGQLTERRVRWSGKSFVSQEGQPSSAIFTGMDVSLIRLMEAKQESAQRDELHVSLIEQNWALQQSRIHLRTFTDAIDEVVFLVHVDGTLLHVNRGFARACGKNVDELEGFSIHETLFPAMHGEFCLNLDLVRQNGLPRQVECHHGERFIRHCLYPVKDGNDQVRAVAWIDQDLTEVMNKETELARTVKNLRSANEELARFAYVSSHDLQEPLRMVSSFMKLLEKRYRDSLPQEAREYIDFAVEGSARMKRMIDDLLQFTRLDSRAEAFVPVSLQSVFQRVYMMLIPEIERTKGSVVSDELPEVTGDVEQLRMLFYNILANGFKFRREDPPVLKIECRREEKYWELRFRDNGLGIDPQYFEKIFIIFTRLHTRDKYPGSGMGLTIAQRIATRHHGTLTVEESSSQGTCFLLVLPILGDVKRFSLNPNQQVMLEERKM